MPQSTDYGETQDTWREAFKPKNRKEWAKWILSIFASLCLIGAVLVVTTAWREGWDSAVIVCKAKTGVDIMENNTNTVIINPKQYVPNFSSNVTGNESPS
jgi:hypothetical protein